MYSRSKKINLQIKWIWNCLKKYSIHNVGLVVSNVGSQRYEFPFCIASEKLSIINIELCFSECDISCRIWPNSRIVKNENSNWPRSYCKHACLHAKIAGLDDANYVTILLKWEIQGLNSTGINHNLRPRFGYSAIVLNRHRSLRYRD